MIVHFIFVSYWDGSSEPLHELRATLGARVHAKACVEHAAVLDKNNEITHYQIQFFSLFTPSLLFIVLWSYSFGLEKLC